MLNFIFKSNFGALRSRLDAIKLGFIAFTLSYLIFVDKMLLEELLEEI